MTRGCLSQSLLAASLAVLIPVMLHGCTAKKPVGLVQDTPEAAWQVFRQQYCNPQKAPGMLVKASLYYSRLKPIKRTNRTVISMWGDFSGTMRLDVSAGIGKLLAHIRENKNGLLAFYPSDKKAYTHVNPVLGATRLGMPFPFSLNELVNVIFGDFSGLVPETHGETGRDKTNFVYRIDDSLVTRITLNETGRPILLEGRTTNAYESAHTWRIKINTYEEGEGGKAPLPDKLTLTLDNGEKGVLRVKSRELKQAPWSARSIGLELPQGVETIRLDNGFWPAENGDIPIVYEDKS